MRLKLVWLSDRHWRMHFRAAAREQLAAAEPGVMVSDDEQKARKRLRSGETFDNTTLYSTAGATESPVIVDVSRSSASQNITQIPS